MGRKQSKHSLARCICLYLKARQTVVEELFVELGGRERSIRGLKSRVVCTVSKRAALAIN